MTIDRNTPFVIGTHNKGKSAELYKALSPYFSDLTDAASLGLDEPVEDGITFEENALIKARYVAEKTNRLALADDSGLVIPSAPGIAGVNTKEYELSFPTIDAAYAALWQTLGGEAPAAAHCVFALAWPDGRTHVLTGLVAGTFRYPATGEYGFGFDKYFYIPALGKRFGEMPPEEKNQHSHRAQAIRQLIALIA